MKAYAVSAFMFVVVAVVSANKREAVKAKMIACAQAVNWSKAQFEESCKTEMPENEAERKTFLAMNMCVLEASEILDGATGEIHPEKVKNLVKPEEAEISIAQAEKCDPKDDSLSIEAKALHLYKCYRTANETKYIQDCLAVGQLL